MPFSTFYSLPQDTPNYRQHSVSFVTADEVVVTCGGRDHTDTAMASCVVFNPIRQQWETNHGVVEDLPGNRYDATAVTLPTLGAYVLAGSENASSNLLLRKGKKITQIKIIVYIDLIRFTFTHILLLRFQYVGECCPYPIWRWPTNQLCHWKIFIPAHWEDQGPGI